MIMAGEEGVQQLLLSTAVVLPAAKRCPCVAGMSLSDHGW